MHRRHLALVAVIGLVALTGCSALTGPSDVDPNQLNENASYEWNTSADASVTVSRSSYTAVYDVDNASTFEVYDRDGLGRERSVPISALRFRYPNGTVVAPSDASLSATKTDSRTTVQLPGNVSGELAFTAPRSGKRFSVPTLIEGGSYAVRLPENARIGIPLLSQASPGGYETTVSEPYMTVRWSEVTRDAISVRYYLQRDLLIFSGLAVIALVVGVGGTLYYYRQLQAVRRRRKEAGIDLEEGDGDDDPRDRGPPPGMR